MTFRSFLLTLVLLFIIGLALFFFVFLPDALYPEAAWPPHFANPS